MGASGPPSLVWSGIPATQIVDLAGRPNGVLAIGLGQEAKPGVWVSP